MRSPCVGIIANPVSARDLRRIVAHAGNLQIAERANMILRAMAGLAAGGVGEAVMMPEKAGLAMHLDRCLARASSLGSEAFPTLRRLDMRVDGESSDSARAAVMMRDLGVDAIIVLGGDGTHRTVVKACPEIPIAGLSTGTNNAFPEIREPTSVGLAVGLAASGRLPADKTSRGCKRLDVNVNDETDIAIVDVAVVDDATIGARALWKPESFRDLFVAFGEPHGIGMSSLAGVLAPVSRRAPYGRRLRLAPAATALRRLRAPIAPGLIATVGVDDVQTLRPDEPTPIAPLAGAVALDGEREIVIGPTDCASVALRLDAFRCIDVEACLTLAAERGLFVTPAITPPPHTPSPHTPPAHIISSGGTSS